jgi:hypothetical protein
MSDIELFWSGPIEVSFTIDGIEFVDKFYPLCGMTDFLCWSGATANPHSYLRRVTTDGD